MMNGSVSSRILTQYWSSIIGGLFSRLRTSAAQRTARNHAYVKDTPDLKSRIPLATTQSVVYKLTSDCFPEPFWTTMMSSCVLDSTEAKVIFQLAFYSIILECNCMIGYFKQF